LELVATDAGAARRESVIELLDHAGIDGLIVSHVPNIRYLTGFTGSAGAALVLRQETVFFSDFRYRTQADHEVGDGVRIEIVPSDIWSRVRAVLGEYAGLDRIGFEEHVVTVGRAREFTQSELATELVPVSRLVEQLRVSKDADEVRVIGEAASLATDALGATLPHVRPGQRELDVAARLEHELRTRGSQWHPFPTIVASGARSALPHAQTSTREIQAGDLLLLDFGAQVDGYCADITRTVVVGGRADERQRTMYDLVRQAQQRAVSHVRAGMTGREADALGRLPIEERGFGDAFGHSLGHGLGLEVHEDPRLSKSNDDALPVDSVVTIEPGVYIPGWGGVRIEDDVHLGADGPRVLSDGDTELRELI
jgi:Xaa-Pro aminopeptidase